MSKTAGHVLVDHGNLKNDLTKFVTDNFGLDLQAERNSSEICEGAEDVTKVSSIHFRQTFSKAFAHRPLSHARFQSIQFSPTQQSAAGVIDACLKFNYRRKLLQTVAHQLHFDVQFVMLCVVSCDNRSVSMLTSFEKHIDMVTF